MLWKKASLLFSNKNSSRKSRITLISEGKVSTDEYKIGDTCNGYFSKTLEKLKIKNVKMPCDKGEIWNSAFNLSA